MTTRRAPLWSLLLQLTVLLLVALVVLIPLLWLLSTSLKGQQKTSSKLRRACFRLSPACRPTAPCSARAPWAVIC